MDMPSKILCTPLKMEGAQLEIIDGWNICFVLGFQEW